MAKIVVLATIAAVLQLAGALTEPDCPVMEGEMIAFVYRSNRARDFARLYFITGYPEGETGFISLCVTCSSVCIYVNYTN